MRNKIGYLWTVAMLGLVGSSCSQEKQAMAGLTKAQYLTRLEEFPESERPAKLRADARNLGQLADSLKDMTYYFGFSLGLSAGGGAPQEVDAEEAFGLVDGDTLRADFLHPERKLFLVQQYATPESGFAFGSGTGQRGFQHIAADDIGYRIRRVMHKGREVAPEALALRRADSVEVEATYRFPVAFDTLAIPLNGDFPIVYRGDTVEVVKREAQEMEFLLPPALARKVLGNQGVLADGRFIANNSHSAFPVIGIHPDRLAQLKALQAKLAAAADDPEAVLENVPDSSFALLARLEAFKQAYLDSEDETPEDMDSQVELLKGWSETFADVLGEAAKQYTLAFPQPVEQVYLYISTGRDSVSRTFMAVNNQPVVPYVVFRDDSSNCFGIVDSVGEVIIAATYPSLREQGAGFFASRNDDDVVTTYSLNADAGELEAFSEGLYYWIALSPKLVVLKNDEGYAGVMDADKQEVIPFDYDGFTLENEIIIAEASLRGRPYYHFYFTDGKRIVVPEKITEARGREGGVFIATREGREGWIDKQGKVTFNDTAQ